MDQIEEIIKNNKLKRDRQVYNTCEEKEDNSKRGKYVKGLITRTLISVIFVLGSLIYINQNDKNKELFQTHVLQNSLSFTKINNLYQNFLGSIDFKKTNNNAKPVFNNIPYTKIESYNNSNKLTVKKGEVIDVITSGIIVFMGEKEDLGYTIIIQGNDGVDIWYSGLENSDYKVYDYVEKGSILGTSKEETIYLTIVKDKNYLTYEEYQKLI